MQINLDGCNVETLRAIMDAMTNQMQNEPNAELETARRIVREAMLFQAAKEVGQMMERYGCSRAED